MAQKNKPKNMSKKLKRNCTETNAIFHDAIVKALYKPLEEAGVALAPIITESIQDKKGTLLTMTISFINIHDSNTKVHAHYVGHKVGLKDTLTLILEF
ncbi:MAG: hypothetical protein JWO53_473 [Chlamydiia bacterium]|nr:hypothetical protein [Chlamydiia bacterium]